MSSTDAIVSTVGDFSVARGTDSAIISSEAKVIEKVPRIGATNLDSGKLTVLWIENIGVGVVPIASVLKNCEISPISEIFAI